MPASPFETTEPDVFACEQCGAEFATKRMRQGHVIGKHRAPDRYVPKGNAHSQWKTIEHGTNGGYQQELRRGIPTCGKCRKAHRKYAKGRYKAIKEAQSNMPTAVKE